MSLFPRSGPSRRSRVLLASSTAAVLIASVTLNVVQARRLGAYLRPAEALPRIGTLAPQLSAKTLDGVPIEITFRNRPTILYYFSPACGWCEKNWLNIEALAAATQGRYRFVGLSTTPDVSAYLAEHRLSFEVYSGLGLETARAYHFGGTPHTVVIGADGRVAHSWSGAYTGHQQDDVERAFGVVLPGIQPRGTILR